MMSEWVIYAHNSIFLKSLRTVMWTHFHFTDKVKKSHLQLCQTVTVHRVTIATGPKPQVTQEGHQNPAQDPQQWPWPSVPCQGQEHSLSRGLCMVPWKWYLFQNDTPFVFIKSLSQLDLFCATSGCLSSLATYSMCLLNFPHVQPTAAFLPPMKWALMPYQHLPGTFHQERSSLRGGWWQWSTESPTLGSGCLLPAAVPCTSKTTAQRASTHDRDLSPQSKRQFLNKQETHSLKCVLLQSRFEKHKMQTFNLFIFQMNEWYHRVNLWSWNIFCKHSSKGRWKARSASVSWQYWGPGIHPESCWQSPGSLRQPARPKSPDSTGNQSTCRAGVRWREERRPRWGSAASRAACSLLPLPRTPMFLSLENFDSSHRLKGMPATEVNGPLWTFGGWLRLGASISLVGFWK